MPERKSTLNPVEPEALNEAIEKFWNYLNVQDKPERSDVIFIMGGSSLQPVYRAAQLYAKGFAPKIAFISQGGRFGGEAVWGVPEEQKYRETLLQLEIPQNAIVSERDPKKQTRNTLAEAQAAIPFLKERGIKPKKIIICSRPVHQRRAFLTFLEQYPDVKYLNCPANEPLRLGDPEEETRIVQEAERLLDYGVKKHDIERPEIPMDVLRAAGLVRSHLQQNGLYKVRPLVPKAI